MTLSSNRFLQAALLGSLLLASSCTAHLTNDATAVRADGEANHPIAVEPSYRSLKVDFGNGLTGPDAARFDDFVAAYRASGNGAIELSVPAGPPAQGAIGFLAERMAALGVPRDKILVSTHDAPSGDYRIAVNYITYEARTDRCGDWSEDLGFTADNSTPKNFGCAVQHNIAAQVADPRDLLGPRAWDPVETSRRATVIDKYEKGTPTQADKHTVDSSVEQSGSASTVGQ